MSYAADISCKDCWSALSEVSDAQLIDVRTSAEWAFVGAPDLSSLGKQVLLAEWQKFPSMKIDGDFAVKVAEELQMKGSGPDSEVFTLCRSGVRSISAAEALTAAGFGNARNVLGGFEGGPDENGHRGLVSGWKFDNLPWRQS